MTTGMSAPPIGSVIVTPKISAAARITQHQRRFGVPVDEQDERAAMTVTAASASGHELAAGDQDRLAGDQALELARSDERAGERDRADDDVEHDEDVRVDARRCPRRAAAGSRRSR